MAGATVDTPHGFEQHDGGILAGNELEGFEMGHAVISEARFVALGASGFLLLDLGQTSPAMLTNLLT